MKKLLWAGLVVAAFTFGIATPFAAQGAPSGGGGGGGGGGGKGGGSGYQGKGGNGYQGKGGQGGGPGQGGPGQGGGGGNWVQEQIDKLGWGENGDEQRVEPGDTVKSADKEARLEAEADKLQLEDKKLRKEFVKLGKKAWEDCEKEDKRWTSARKKVADEPEKLAKEVEKHKEALDKAWKVCDDDILKKEILVEDLLKLFQKNTEDLRKETATDKSVRQDEIRARKVAEIRKQAADYMKGGAGAGDNEEKDKKEKKEEEEE
ncbi:MAG: hypothetical protein IT464_12290 [Planctomycetes bacterium]|nr:hypothetical protein [Planctomycetota bacterium]